MNTVIDTRCFFLPMQSTLAQYLAVKIRWRYLGGKSEKTKQLWSLTPGGFARVKNE